MKILLAVDGSECSTRSAQYLADHLDMFKPPIDLNILHVAPGIPMGLAAMQARAILGKELIDQYTLSEATKALAPAEKIFTDLKLPFQSSYQVGDPATEICKMAGQWHCDLIVMGSKGHGLVKGMVMGSVSTKVVAGSPDIPVLIVK